MRRLRYLSVALLVVIAALAWGGPHPWVSLAMRLQGCEYRTIQTANFTIGFYDSGDEELPPMVLAHGFLVDGALNWFNMVPRLKERYRLIIPDLLNADSEYVRGGSYTLREEGDLLRELCAALRLERPRMVFFSAGALIAPGFTDSAEVVLISPPPLGMDAFFSDMNALFSRDAAWFAAATFKNPPPGMGLFTKLTYGDWQKERGRFLEVFSAQYEAWSKLDLDSENLLMIIPEDDRFFPSAQALFSAGRRNVLLLSGSGHGATWDQPDRLAAMLAADIRP